MKMPSSIILIMVALLSLSGEAQSIEESTFIHTGLTAGKASDNSYTRTEPATLIMTFPEADTVPNSYSIDGFIAYNRELNPSVSFSFEVERHKNTLISKKQDNFQFGISLKKLWGFGSNPEPLKLATTKIIKYPIFYLRSEIKVRQSHDYVKDSKGYQIIGAVSFELPNPSTTLGIFEFLRPFQYYPVDDRTDEEIKNEVREDPAKFIQIIHTHNIGIERLEYEALTLLNTSFGIKIYPFSGLLFKEFKKYGIFELGYSYEGRNRISSSNSSLYVGPLRTYSAKINFWFDDNRKKGIAIGYDHINGGNPLKGLSDNEYGQFGISAILKE